MQIYLIYDNLTQDDAWATIRKIYFHLLVSAKKSILFRNV